MASGAEGAHHDVTHGLFGQRGRVDDHGVQSARFRNQRSMRRKVGRHGAVDGLRGFRRSGEAHTANACGRGQRRADRFTGTGQELQRGAWNTRLVHQPRAERADQGRFLGRLRQHSVARRQCARDLTRKDREGEVPRADARDRAKWDRIATRDPLRLRRVITQEVHRLAQLRYRVGQCLAGFSCQQSEYLSVMLFVEHRRAAQYVGALVRGRIPWPCAFDRAACVRLAYIPHRADALIGASGVRLFVDTLSFSIESEQRLGVPFVIREALARVIDRFQRQRIA